MEEVGSLTRPQNCKDCQKEYQANVILITGKEMDLSGGWCPKCRAIRRQEHDKQQEAQRQLAIATRRREWRTTCGIPDKFMNEGFGTFKTDREGNIKKTYRKCLEYAQRFPIEYGKYLIEAQKSYPSLVLFSDNWGVGKSHLASAIAHKILEGWQGEDITCPVKFMSEPDLYREIYATFYSTTTHRDYSAPTKNEESIINTLCYPVLLILDDVGKETRRDPRFVQRILFAIIDGRYKSLKPIVLTSNLNPEGLRDYLGGGDNQASFDRLWEMCDGKLWHIKGESYRRKSKANSQ